MIQALLKNIGSYKKDALMTPFFVTLEVILDIIIPVLMALIIDRGIAVANQQNILWKIKIILRIKTLNSIR